jgi:hypothetical protein
MKTKTTLIALVLVTFAAATAYAVHQHGYLGFFDLVLANSATQVVLFDLCIALTMVCVWMWRDARDEGLSPLPYLGLTLLLGSIGPLLYLLRRDVLDARWQREPRFRDRGIKRAA